MVRTLIFGQFVLMLVAFSQMATEQLFAEDVVVFPEPKAGPLDNPLKGWCPYTDAGTIHQPYSMVFQYISWRELESIESQFRFEDWERSWDRGAAKDKHIIFRVYVDYPSNPSGLPDWLRKAGVEESSYDDYGGGKSPDYDDPRMIAAMEKFIAALGQRYNNDPRIAFIQLGMLGFWGEWHTYPRSELYASTTTEQRIIDAYRKAFPSKSLMVRYSRDYAGQQDWIGFHDDMFPEDTDNGKNWSFLAGLKKEKRTENWNAAVIGGEMVPGKARLWMEKDFGTTMTMLNRAHFTWVGPYCPALVKSNNENYLENCENLIRMMGYEYQITQVSHSNKTGDPVQISLKGKNQGCAPFYYPWSIEWALLDDSEKPVSTRTTDWDIRKWQPGPIAETTELDFDVPPGNYRLAIGIRDPWKNQPAIRFANDLPVVEGWTIVSEIVIEN